MRRFQQKILVTGGCGYVGTPLTKKLLDNGYFVKVVDTQWFGNHLGDNQENLIVEKREVSSLTSCDLEGIDTVIHLANVANDPGVELNPTLSWEINTLDLTKLLQACAKSKVRNFINASSGSVYGVKVEERVTEDLELLPISIYNKTKMVAERICLSYKDSFRVVNVRPATVCGFSPRMRFDVVVNMFVLQAHTKGEITVLGGDQIRPNIHISDMVDVYLHLLNNENLISGNINAGFENMKVLEIAELVSEIVGCKIIQKESNDPRSYKQDSTKLLQSGFKPKHSVRDAILDINERLDSKLLFDMPQWHTVSMMKELNLGSNK